MSMLLLLFVIKFSIAVNLSRGASAGRSLAAMLREFALIVPVRNETEYRLANHSETFGLNPNIGN